jgi:hypothetical protein
LLKEYDYLHIPFFACCFIDNPDYFSNFVLKYNFRNNLCTVNKLIIKTSKYMRKLMFIFCGFILAASLSAQSAIITFEKNTHDFGKIKEQDGVATVVFSFQNTGDAPLVINRVQASCGCTTPSWTREPILPGKTGNITAAYNPANRPGTFIKSISVFSNADTKPILLTIKGDVIPKPAVAR